MFGKFFLKKLWKKEMEGALGWLDELAQKEARIAAAQILKLAHIADNLNKAITLMNVTSSVFATRRLATWPRRNWDEAVVQ